MDTNHNDNFYNNTAKLRWACRRGMLELDIILGKFLETHYPSLSYENKLLFIRLLNCTDPELFSWLLGHSRPEDTDLCKIVDIIRHGTTRT